MSTNALKAQPNVATRIVAGISMPDTSLISRAIDFAREETEPYLFNHVMRFTHAVCRIVERRPTTTYDNFARDFGERFVPGYKPVSTVDFLMNAPFQN